MVIDATVVSAFTIGDRVFHQKFGYGEVMGVEGDKLEIEFDKAGAKKVVGKFVVSADAASDVPSNSTIASDGASPGCAPGVTTSG